MNEHNKFKQIYTVCICTNGYMSCHAYHSVEVSEFDVEEATR